RGLGLWCRIGRSLLVLQTDLPGEVRWQNTVRATAAIRAGQRKHVSLTYSAAQPAIIPPLGLHAHAKVEQTIGWWQAWSRRCTYDGPYRDAVNRSILALKLLLYAP